MPINLKNAIKLAGKTQKEMAESLCIDYAMISRYITGKSQPTEKVLMKIADYLDVSVDFLLGREENIGNKQSRDKCIVSIEEKISNLQYFLSEIKEELGKDNDYVSVPLLEDPIAAGAPIPISGRSSEKRYFNKNWIKRFSSPILILVGKDQLSMFPTIQSGDLLLIDRNPVYSPTPDHIYAINTKEGGTVKRCHLVGHKLKLIPDNPDYSNHIIDVDEIDISKIIVGRIVWIARELA